MKHIHRWGLMRCTREENLCEHSFETAVIAHALAVLRNTRFGGSVSPERAAALALFHDAPEIFTGDLPTPVKYGSRALRDSYAAVEEHARARLLGALPEDLRPVYRPLLAEDGKGGEEELVSVSVPLPYNMDGIIINLSAYLEGLPEEAYLTEFVPAVVPSTEEDEEVVTGDDMMMGDF